MVSVEEDDDEAISVLLEREIIMHENSKSVAVKLVCEAQASDDFVTQKAQI